MSEALLVTCRCGTVYDAGESFYCPVCSAPRNLAQPMQAPGGPPSGPPMGAPPQGPPPGGAPGYYPGPAPTGPGAGAPMGGYPDYGMQPVEEKSTADVARGAGKLLQALSFVVLAIGILAVLGYIVMAFTSSAGKLQSAVGALTVLVAAVGFFGLLKFASMVAEYVAHKYEDAPEA